MSGIQPLPERSLRSLREQRCGRPGGRRTSTDSPEHLSPAHQRGPAETALAMGPGTPISGGTASSWARRRGSTRPSMRNAGTRPGTRTGWPEFGRTAMIWSQTPQDAGSQGGFNRSLHHLVLGGVDGQASMVDGGVDRTVADEVPGCAGASAGSGTSVLAGDHEGSARRGGGSCGRHIPGGGLQVVPARWRHATDGSCSAVRPVSVALRVKGERTAAAGDQHSRPSRAAHSRGWDYPGASAPAQPRRG